MKRLRQAFFDEGARLDAHPDTRDLAQCWLCKQRIDYSVPPNSTPDSHNLDHYVTIADDPTLQEDPTNFRHAHADCNAARGRRAPSPGLGEPIPDWG
jgi:5-methylcytosine-specific restriction endonuclease McrA